MPRDAEQVVDRIAGSEPNSDGDECPFCGEANKQEDHAHVLSCLKKHHEHVRTRNLNQAADDGCVRVQTTGKNLLTDEGTGWEMEIPAAKVTCDENALRHEVLARLFCRVHHYPKPDQFT